MTTVKLKTDHGDLTFHLDGSELCAVCGLPIKAAMFIDSEIVATGDANGFVFACVDHFLEPGTPEYNRSLRKMAEATVRKIGL